ncbi:RES family NAD+ phosphorylase [Jeotgalibacillus marinus]|uniref:RES family NAD+ phosphorylase n=1 Tax=Jeotgalibacillus marinus TaxID=86667 RepID=A0ABV3Q0X2_9BACL
MYAPTTHGEHYFHQIECPTDHGAMLEELIQEDWQVFSEEKDYDKLLFDILNYHREYYDSLNNSDLYSRDSASFTYVSNIDIWNNFADSIKKENRYFCKNDLSNKLESLLPKKSLKFDPNSVFYRARIGNYTLEKMGPPPYDKATSGRGNPKGIPYLYVASNKYTCIAETRPWVGAEITIATIHLKEPIEVIDLSSKVFLSSPFLMDDLSQNIESIILLNKLSDELSKPINPFESDIEYIPTQYLTELIKNLGYDGLKFKSSLGAGENFVFFSLKKFEYITLDKCNVSGVGYDYAIESIPQALC